MQGFIKRVPGFRTDTTWKKVLASIGYLFLLITFVPIILQGSFMDSIWNVINLVAMLAFFGSIIALMKGNLNFFHIRNRKRAAVVLVVSAIAVGTLPFPAGSERAAGGHSDIEEKPQANVENENLKDQQETSESEQETEADKEKKPKEEGNQEKKKEKTEAAKDEKQDETNKTEKQQGESPGKASTDDQNDQGSDHSQVEKNETNQETSKNNTSPSNQPDHGVDASVTRVVDGDTIKINLNGKQETVRLLLVDTPETKHPSKPVQPFGPEASDFAKRTLSGKSIQLEYDGPKRDKYDRLLAYVWVDGKMFNQMLLEKGLARLAYVYDPPYTHYQTYMKAQNRAKRAERGIWSRDGYVTDEGFYYQKGKDTSSDSNTRGDSSAQQTGDQKYDPNGPDRDCGDFDTQQQAQNFFKAAGGPESDPHRLDRDNDGVVCESLP
ncbi:hypothetical protein FH966_01375 [Lentibacillus cibarius]|uniref:TNase-like domain-containing protein n=1 Tax=Lentibacillus cibarius TaxID=2583219 RepID=A0A549YF20_9BACI|nr:thermonuclease family protein [Lentibacillus cibarius]TMN21574.1 hypothetical protein FFL34_05225 [Lentibacillus cibarius]TRM10476.1 hypothetical protein FH966_01375 [Lentibacillus cibarius]